METDVFTNYEPVKGIRSYGCGYLSFSFKYTKNEKGQDLDPVLHVTMHYAGEGEFKDRDLLLTFEGVITMRWNPDIYSTLDINSLSEVRASGSTGALRYSTNSFYLKKYTETYPHMGEGCVNYFICGEEDLLELIALPNAKAEWI